LRFELGMAVSRIATAASHNPGACNSARNCITSTSSAVHTSTDPSIAFARIFRQRFTFIHDRAIRIMQPKATGLTNAAQSRSTFSNTL
jgi:hypothetical protein